MAVTGGNSPQRPDQVTTPQQATVAPGGAGGIFRGKLVIVSGAGFSGVFDYLGAPSFGNLRESMTSLNGTDPWGNAYLQGFVTYANPNLTNLKWLAIQYTSSGMQAYSATTAAGPWSNLDGASNLMPGFAIGEGGFGGAEIDWNQSAMTLGLINTALPITALAPGATSTTAETWHSLGSPGATGYTSVHGRYRMTPMGEVEFDIQLVDAGTGTAGIYSYANTLPSAYRPSIDRYYPIGVQGTNLGASRAPGLRIQTTGAVAVMLPTIGVAGNLVGGTAIMPLD